jgi:hypothetical protein
MIALGSASTAAAEESVKGCVESIPQGAQRPEMTEQFPSRGMSGYAATLTVTVSHGKGESVLPSGLQLQSAGDAAAALKAAGFAIPDQDGGAAARLTPLVESVANGRAVTKLELPLVALPKEPGRHTLTLPPMPIAVARANGEIATLCTHPHVIVVEDPIAQTPNPTPKENPPARVQREEWKAARTAATWGAAGIAIGALLGWLLYKWLKRPKPAPPPPPPRPAWEVALERLDEVRHAGLLETKRYGEYFDRVSDAIRQYLGAVFAFDGLECTSDEIIAALKKAPTFAIPIPEIQIFLSDCDLVKFADLTPSQEECVKVLAQGESIVRRTMPITVDAIQREVRP